MSQFEEIDRLAGMQDDLVRELDHVDGVNGIGIGRGNEPGSLAFHVKVYDPSAATRIPRTFRGVDIVIDVIGRVRAAGSTAQRA